MRTVLRAMGLVLELVAWYMVGLWVRSTNRKLREEQREALDD